MKRSFLRQALPLWLLRSVTAADILEQWIHPLEREPFFNDAPRHRTERC